MRRLWEKFCAFLFGLMAGLALLMFFYQPSRQWPADLITRHDADVTSADAVILLMGGVSDRTPHCARLLKKGLAPKIVFVEAEKDELNALGLRPSDGEASLRYLQKLGIKDDAIIFDNSRAVTSSAEEMAADFKLIKERLPAARRLILCTSWYHSSRAHWIADKVNNHYFELKSMPSPKPKVWYAMEFDFLMVFNEYLKWAYYLTHY
ncbi:MAG TPA: YdcF family protein [Oligoflexus sp.]|uniref:YdcF family protein n=1 Tax=Oligoflexus sp. TaxID=1971216 RepID=UPI002D5A9EF0|nr:YdcF family protein [Oligoflexus sp.]HYX39326.1 YdcF family protein [Oligoflexus sp.]